MAHSPQWPESPWPEPGRHQPSGAAPPGDGPASDGTAGPVPGPQPPYGSPTGYGYQTPAQPHPGYPYQGYHYHDQPYPGHPYHYPGYPYPPSPAQNGLSIAAMVVSVFAAASMCASYGLTGYIGIVGAILGHVARRQIRDRHERGDGMARAGVIVGWIAAGIALAATVVVVMVVRNELV